MENNKGNNFDHWYELADTVNIDTISALAKTLRASVTNSEELGNATIAVIKGAAQAMCKDLNVGPEYMHLISILAYRKLNDLSDGYTTIFNYNDMLDPSLKYKFERSIPVAVFEDLQEKAQELLDEPDKLHPAQRKHLENILSGRVPFGFTIMEEDYAADPRNYLPKTEPVTEEEPSCDECENCDCVTCECETGDNVIEVESAEELKELLENDKIQLEDLPDEMTYSEMMEHAKETGLYDKMKSELEKEDPAVTLFNEDYEGLAAALEFKYTADELRAMPRDVLNRLVTDFLE